MQHKQGFTLIELVTAIIIVVILVTMAVPLYEKTVERSRLAEARTILAKLQDAKLAAMDSMDCRTYNTESSNCPKLRHLNVAFAETQGDFSFDTDAFRFSIAPAHSGSAWVAGAVCARRLGGDYDGTIFLYAAPGVEYRKEKEEAPGVFEESAAKFNCVGTACPNYGLQNSGGLSGLTCN